MVQAHAHELLNQKEAGNRQRTQESARHPLYAASERLAAALDRLENNLGRLPQHAAAEPKDDRQLVMFEQENHSLKAERENLNSAIGQLKFQYDDLHQVASTIYSKLNDSIKRLTHIIEN